MDGKRKWITSIVLWMSIFTNVFIQSQGSNECGGSILSTAGTIQSPGYSQQYPSNLDCVWDVRTYADHYIQFTINAPFDVEYNYNNCGYDYVEIFDMYQDGTNVTLGRLCGNMTTRVIHTTNTHAVVVFHSNHVRNGRGFQMLWKGVSNCGGIMQGKRGVIESPDFPKGRHPYLECRWQISVPVGHRVRLEFNETFQVEYNYNHCQYDYVEVFDINVRQRLVSLGRFCGNKRPPVLSSSGSKMDIRFHTDGFSTNELGFSAVWEAVSYCGGFLNGTNGTIQSYDYPSRYPNNMDCSWEIVGPSEGYKIELTFGNLFDIEQNYNGCGYDYVEVFSLVNNHFQSMGRFCGKIPPPTLRSFSRMKVVFHSNQRFDGNGFSATWKTSCDESYQGMEGNITSHNYPNNYPNNMDCVWDITVPKNHIIYYKLDGPFEIEYNHNNCNYDYLTISHRTVTGIWTRDMRVCGSTKYRPRVSRTNEMKLIFHSNDRNNHVGFSLNWKAVPDCRQVFHQPSGDISTPNYPQPYYNGLDCLWEINVPAGHFIKLTFNNRFDLESYIDYCPVYIELSDAYPNGTVIPQGRFCGSTRPSPQTSSTSKMLVRFKSSFQNFAHIGFYASWSTVR